MGILSGLVVVWIRGVVADVRCGFISTAVAGVLNGSIGRRHPVGVALLRASSALITGPSGGCGAFSVGVWYLVVGVEVQVCVSNTDLCVVGVALVVYHREGGW
jgi:hypothetical protein